MIKLDRVSKSYGAIKILENISVNAEPGKSVCVVGRSGCGKSTLLKIIALIAKPDQGSIQIDGLEVTKLSEVALEKVRKEKIAYSFQEPLLIPYMTALENITEMANIGRDKAVEKLSYLGLSSRLYHKPSKLSVGEKKRVDIARAILREIPILIADEPLSNLDHSSGLKVMELLKEHTTNGGTVVFSSVEPSEAKFADNVITM